MCLSYGEQTSAQEPDAGVVRGGPCQAPQRVQAYNQLISSKPACKPQNIGDRADRGLQGWSAIPGMGMERGTAIVPAPVETGFVPVSPLGTALYLPCEDGSGGGLITYGGISFPPCSLQMRVPPLSKGR